MRDETRRKIDKAVKISLIIAGILLIANDIYWRLHGASTRTGADNNSPAQQVDRIAEYTEQSRRENQSAGEAIKRADAGAERAEAGIKKSSDILAEIRQDNRRAKCILDELISNAQTGAAQDAPH